VTEHGASHTAHAVPTMYRPARAQGRSGSAQGNLTSQPSLRRNDMPEIALRDDIGGVMKKRFLTILALACVLATTACEPWWYHHDRGGYDHEGHDRAQYDRGGEGYGHR